jgi:hypothetical protein
VFEVTKLWFCYPTVDRHTDRFRPESRSQYRTGTVMYLLSIHRSHWALLHVNICFLSFYNTLYHISAWSSLQAASSSWVPRNYGQPARGRELKDMKDLLGVWGGWSGEREKVIDRENIILYDKACAVGPVPQRCHWAYRAVKSLCSCWSYQSEETSTSSSFLKIFVLHFVCILFSHVPI